MYQLAALAFILAAAGGAGYLAQRPTVATSAGLEQLLRDSAEYGGAGITSYRCDDQVPIGVDGARYACDVGDAKGARQYLRCTIYRSGSFQCGVDHTDRPSAKSGDAWE